MRAAIDDLRRRGAIFGADPFGDPSWSMLLDLLASELAGRKVSVSDLCLASGASVSTALAHLARMQGRGWIVRTPDPRDRRRVWVSLASDVRALLASYFRGTPRPVANRGRDTELAAQLRAIADVLSGDN